MDAHLGLELGQLLSFVLADVLVYMRRSVFERHT